MTLCDYSIKLSDIQELQRRQATFLTGDFQVHGVTQTRTITGNLKVNGGVVTMTSEFMVKCADHHIDIPQIVFHHIAESIRVRVSATYTVLKNNNPSK